MPERLIQSNRMLKLQWDNIRTLIPCFLKSLYTGSVEVKLHELDKVFTGIIKLRGNLGENILDKVASLWYYLTRVFHQSVGPRVGNFAEELIAYWVVSGGLYNVIGRNITLESAFNQLGIGGIRSTSKVDFVFRSTSSERIALVELRMSEHTGGRTAQQSLLDKIDSVLRSLEEQKTLLREKLIRKGVREVDLSIAILFSENHELLTKNNFNKGRLTSLVNYTMDERHVWGILKKLSGDHGYKLCDSSAIDKENIQNSLLNPDLRRVCIQDRSSSLRIWLKILFGDEFFEEYVGSSLNNLLAKHRDIIADDIWLFYTITINELKIASQFGRTHVRKIYEELLTSNIFNQFINNIYNINLPLDRYIVRFNQWIENCAKKVIDVYREKGEKLILLETSDLVANFEYLKQLCICALAEYITIDYKRDRGFSECLWT
uniref:Uncharacterized protein n=1 Tax=Thermosphaera aggregans TaxID=54254 RepID=A0A7C2FE97_9CREN